MSRERSSARETSDVSRNAGYALLVLLSVLILVAMIALGIAPWAALLIVVWGTGVGLFFAFRDTRPSPGA